MSQEELAAFIQTKLREHGIYMVESGGAVVAIYTDGKYVSANIDLVVEGFASDRKIESLMSLIGFNKFGRLYESLETELFIDFVAPPLSVGREPVKEIHELRLATGLLHLLSPTDCVKDRLVAYYYFNDRQALEQAVLVAQARIVDLAEVQRWSEAEGMGERYGDFAERLTE